MDTLSIADLVMMSHRFMDVRLEFAPEKFQLTGYEADVMPGMIARLLDGIGIEKARPRYRLGRVASFDVTPFARADPVVVVCAAMDLSDYYRMWTRLMRVDRFDIGELIPGYDAAMRGAIRSARELHMEEIHFAICEMLHFRNVMVGRVR